MYFIQYIKPLLVKPVKPYGITDSKRVARTISPLFSYGTRGFLLGGKGFFFPYQDCSPVAFLFHGVLHMSG